jgi:hypothetical protein
VSMSECDIFVNNQVDRAIESMKENWKLLCVHFFYVLFISIIKFCFLLMLQYTFHIIYWWRFLCACRKNKFSACSLTESQSLKHFCSYFISCKHKFIM